MIIASVLAIEALVLLTVTVIGIKPISSPCCPFSQASITPQGAGFR